MFTPEEVVEVEIRIKGQHQTMIMTVPQAQDVRWDVKFEHSVPNFYNSMEVHNWKKVEVMSLGFRPLEENGRYATVRYVDNEPPA
jgi:hypothetical protein